MSTRTLCGMAAAVAAMGLSACGGGSSSPVAGTTGTTGTSAAVPTLFAYLPDWVASPNSGGVTPQMTSSDVDILAYGFPQVGDCDPGNLGTEAAPTCTASAAVSGHVEFFGNQDGALHATNPDVDFGTYMSGGTNWGGGGGYANALKTAKHVVLSIGGWYHSQGILAAIQTANEATFATSVVTYLRSAEADAAAVTSNKFYGVDIDWMPNSDQWSEAAASTNNHQLTQADLQAYLAFLTDLKAKLAAAGYPYLSIAVPADTGVLQNVDSTYGASGGFWKAVAALGVTLQMQTVDYQTQQREAAASMCGSTEFDAPLNNDPLDPCSANNTGSVAGSVAGLETLGVPAGSIGIVVPTMQYSYALNSSGVAAVTSTNPYTAFSTSNTLGRAPGDNGVGFSTRWILSSLIFGHTPSSSPQLYWTVLGSSATADQSYAESRGVDTDDAGALIPLTTHGDAAKVAAWAAQQGLASVAVESLDQDAQQGDFNVDWATQSLVSGLRSGLGQ